MRKLLILGAGTAGTMMANKMRRKLKTSEWDITIVDKSDKHYYQPGLIFVPFKLFGYTGEKGNVKSTKKFIPDGVNFIQGEVTKLDPDNNKVETTNGTHKYDYLILAMGCRIAPEEVPGMTEGYNKNVFYFYTMKSALDLQKAIENFDGGKFVLDIVESPIKCPVAPIEFICLADYYFRLKGIRDKVQLEVMTSAGSIFTKPVAKLILNNMFIKKDITSQLDFSVAEVDSDKKKVKSYDGKEMDFDMLVAIPPNLGPSVIDEAGLGNGMGYAMTNPHTLKSEKYNNIYVLGDNTNVSTSKAGSVAHFEANVVEKNLLNEITGKKPHDSFDGHSLCYIESGFKKAHLIDFSYLQEPVPGKLPFPIVGPYTLLKETRINHWGKLFFRWYYWNLLLKDRFSRPLETFLPTKMSYVGKDESFIGKKSLRE